MSKLSKQEKRHKKYSEKSILKLPKFKFKIGDKIKYIGDIHHLYQNKEGIITKRQVKKHRKDYSVLFDGENKEIDYILESVLELIEGEEKMINNSRSSITPT